MELLKELDEKATQQRVKRFLKDEFKQLVSESEFTLKNIQSPSWDDMPSGHGIENSNELKMVNSLNATVIVEQVISAINGIGDADCIHILKLRYLLGLSWDLVAERIGRSERNTFEYANRAYIHFARSFKAVDLRVFK